MVAQAPVAPDAAAPRSGLARFKDRAMRLLARINEHRVMLIAAGVTYYLLLSLVPTLTLFVTLYGLFNDPTTVARQVDLLAGVVPAGGLDIVRDQLTRLTDAPRGALSLALVGSLAVALWSASAGIKSLFDAMNIAYEEEETRNFFVLSGLALLFTLGGIVAALVVVAAVVVIPVVVRLFYIGSGAEWLVTGLGYLVMLAVLFFGIGALYRWGPAVRHTRWSWLSPGTLLGLIATAIVSVLFSWYAANFGNYNATYGSLGALVGLMTWLWLTVTGLIIGGELNAEAEHRHLAARPAAAADRHPATPRRPSLVAMALVLLPVALLALAERREANRGQG
jgi:membrane protein